MNSILTSIKKLLGIAEEYEQFDTDIIIQINMAFSILNQLGVGPENGFIIQNSSAVWTDFLGEDTQKLEMVKTFIYLKVRIAFDPPQNSSLLEAMNRQVDELTWRINIAVDPGDSTE